MYNTPVFEYCRPVHACCPSSPFLLAPLALAIRVPSARSTTLVVARTPTFRRTTKPRKSETARTATSASSHSSSHSSSRRSQTNRRGLRRGKKSSRIPASAPPQDVREAGRTVVRLRPPDKPARGIRERGPGGTQRPRHRHRPCPLSRPRLAARVTTSRPYAGTVTMNDEGAMYTTSTISP